MKLSPSTTGLMSITLIYLIFVPTASNRPQFHNHHQGSHYLYRAQHAVAAGSVSGPVSIGGEGRPYSHVATALPTRPGYVGSPSANRDGSACNCTSGYPTQSVGSKDPASIAGTVELSQKQPGTADATHYSSVTQAHSTESQQSNSVRVAKRIETANPSPPVAVGPSNPSAGAYQSFQLGPISTSSTSSTTQMASATLSAAVCPTSNGTVYTSTQGQSYKIVCDLDYLNNDIRFILASSFDDCVQQCDAYNTQSGSGNGCVGALFVPSRIHGTNDCYLKSTVNDPTAAQLSMIVGLLLSPSTSSSAPSVTATLVESPSAMTIPYPIGSTTSSGVSVVPQPTIAHAPGTSVVQPSPIASHLHGPSFTTPTTEYIDWMPPADIKLDSQLLSVGVNDALSSTPASLDTGVLELDAAMESLLRPLSGTPHISRDGGKGGYLNGQHLFIFCDTGSYTAPTDSSNGDFLGFVSSSVAIDAGLNGLRGQPLSLEDGIGQWRDNVGRMRGFSPMTQGEQSYNLAMQGDGQRYAVWPESSLIPLDATQSILYAPIVYDNVNMATKAAAFTYTGAALLTITAGGNGGPVATRTVDKLFSKDEVEWGCIGGIRSWGPSGVGGTDGRVYLFGKVAGGLLLARTGHDSITDPNSYEYWSGTAWLDTMPPSSSTAYFVAGSFMDVDVFYSPRHLTFIIVYLNTYVDNTFYFRYLEADHAILPPSVAGTDPSTDYVEALVAYPWSAEQALYKASPGLSGKYIYAGGVHQGYFGDDDIANGGAKMLLSWTAPTGLNPASQTSEYQLVTAAIEWA